jgi:hypothetical protein
MREIIDIDVEIRTHEQTLRDLHQQVVAGDEIVNEFSASHDPFICSALFRATYWSVIKCKYRKS